MTVQPIVVASTNGLVALDAAWKILDQGGPALDAVEAAVRLVEDNPDDHTVGYGGYPNLLGEVELDASIMDGTTRRAGAVGALRNYRYAITVARAVMERLPHVLVAGVGAEALAEEIGLRRENLLTPEAERVWREGLEGRAEPGSIAEAMLARRPADPEHVTGTVNVMARDSSGHVASGVSTSGWAWKFPGRLGDSPVIGAGNYADDRYGAAACTGHGELAMRSLTSLRIVEAMRAGSSLEDALRQAFADLRELAPDAMMSAIALGADGSHCAMATRDGVTYVVRDSSGTQTLARLTYRP